jgi:hypothetical protein
MQEALVAADSREANVFLSWMRLRRPGDYRRLFDHESHGVPVAELLDLWIGSSMLIGKRVLQDARNAHERFLLFFSNRGESDTSLVTAQRVQLFLNHVASTAESEAERKGKVCKGTAAQAVYKQLRALGFVLGSSLEPFDDHMLKVSLRTPRSGVAPPAHSSTLSVAAQIHFEHVAATHSRPMVRHAAACFAAMGIHQLARDRFLSSFYLGGPRHGRRTFSVAGSPARGQSEGEHAGPDAVPRHLLRA